MKVSFDQCYLLIKEAPKSCFTHYWWEVINVFNTSSCKSAFSTYSFGKLVFRLAAFTVSLPFPCFELGSISDAL